MTSTAVDPRSRTSDSMSAIGADWSPTRTRANPLTSEQVKGLRGVRPAGPPPRPSTEPIRVQRRASNTGVIMVAGQKVALGRVHKH